MREKSHSVGGLYVVDVGEGEPVLMLHGISSSADAFRYQAADLADAYRLLAWDAPGYARSADPAAPPGMDGYADAAKGVLDVLRVGRAHVVGASWGGVVATRLALRHPGCVASLALIGSTPGLKATAGAAENLRLRSRQIADHGIVTYARDRAGRVLAPDVPAELAEEVQDRIIGSVRLPGYRYAAESLAETDHRPKLRSIGTRTLALVGEHDTITGLEASQELAQGIPGSHLVVIPAAGHLANQETPKVVNAELHRHWREASILGSGTIGKDGSGA